MFKATETAKETTNTPIYSKCRICNFLLNQFKGLIPSFQVPEFIPSSEFAIFLFNRFKGFPAMNRSLIPKPGPCQLRHVLNLKLEASPKTILSMSFPTTSGPVVCQKWSKLPNQI
jgi:hypothetical protein